jgi:hypothetical protein
MRPQAEDLPPTLKRVVDGGLEQIIRAETCPLKEARVRTSSFALFAKPAWTFKRKSMKI